MCKQERRGEERRGEEGMVALETSYQIDDGS